MILCGILILFFAWLLIHAFIYSKSDSKYRIIEGMDPSAAPTAAPTAAAPTTTTTTTEPSQTQIDENAAQLAILKTQIASLINTATQLNAATLQNEVGIQNNVDGIQKVVKSQADMQTKLANAKSAQ
jgi:small neutral amino acid transporter SnatA (MarC family)